MTIKLGEDYLIWDLEHGTAPRNPITLVTVLCTPELGFAVDADNKVSEGALDKALNVSIFLSAISEICSLRLCGALNHNTPFVGPR
jgi:hypothetical protein